MHLTDPDIPNNLETILNSLQTTVGKEIAVRIILTDRNFDRHGSTYSEFRMNVDEVLSRFSGGRIMISGTNSLVEMDVKRVQEYFEESSKEIRWIEQLTGEQTKGNTLLRSVTLSITRTSDSPAGISKK